MNDVIRFDIYFRGGVPELIPSLDGRYMRFDDHEKAIARIAKLPAERDRYRLALEEIESLAGSENSSVADRSYGSWDIARNALRDEK